MATVTLYPTTDTAVTGTWTTPTNVQASDGSVASVTSAASKNVDAGIREQGSFGADAAIPSNAVINSVTLETRQMVSTTAGIANLGARLRLGTTDGTENLDTAEPTTLTARSYASQTRPGGGTWTRADLLDGTLKTRIRGANGNSATAVTYSWDYIRVVVDYTVPTEIFLVSDNFDDNSIDGAKWVTSGAAVTEVNNRIQIVADSTYPSIRNATSTFTLIDSNVHVEVPVLAGAATSTLAFRDDGNTNGVRFDISNDGNLYMIEVVAGTASSTSVTYNATNHRWLRLRHNTVAGLVYWETSPDGLTWTVQRSKAPGIPLSPYRAWLYAGGTSPTGFTAFDNLNIVPSGGSTLTQSVGDTATLADGVCFGVTSVVADAATLSDLASPTSGLVIGDAAALADAASFGVARVVADAATLSDSVAPTSGVLIGSISDNFDDNSAAAIWTDTAGVAETGGKTIVTASTAYPSRRTSTDYTLTGSAASIEVPARASAATSSFSFRDSGNTNGFRFDISNDGNLYMIEVVASTPSTTSVTFNATSHRWLRLRHDVSAALVYWETSPDGLTWTAQRSKAPAAPLTGQIWMYAGGTSPTGTTEFDNFNITPTAAVPGAPTITSVTPGDQSLVVAFSAPASDGGAAIIEYEVLEELAGLVQSVGDTLSLADAFAFLFGESVADAATLADARALGVGETAADAITPADALALGVGESAADALAVADSPTANSGVSISAGNDALSVADSSGTQSGKGVSVVDPLTVADAATTAAVVQQGIADALSLLDAQSRFVTLGVSDPLIPLDAIVTASGRELTLPETLALADAVGTNASGGVTVSDVAALIDAFSFDRSTAVVDASTLADAALAARGADVGVTDSATLADAVSRISGWAVVSADAIAVTDAQTFAVGWSPLLTDALTVADATALARGVQQSITDAGVLADAQTVARQIASALADVLGVSDAIARDLALTLPDVLVLTDIPSISGAVNKSVADTLTVADLADPNLGIALGSYIHHRPPLNGIYDRSSGGVVLAFASGGRVVIVSAGGIVVSTDAEVVGGV